MILDPLYLENFNKDTSLEEMIKELERLKRTRRHECESIIEYSYSWPHSKVNRQISIIKSLNLKIKYIQAITKFN